MLHEQRVEGDPVLPREDLAQPRLGLLGRPGANDTEAIRDPVDVGVDRDRGNAVAEDEHAVRRLRPDRRERRQRFEGARHDPAEPGEDLPRARPDRTGLGVVEPRSPDQRLDRPGGGAGEGGRVGKAGEEPRAGRVGRLVPGPLGEDRPDQHLERILGVVPEVRGPPVPREVQLREPVEDRFPVGGGELAQRDRPRAAGRGGLSVAASGGRGPTPGSERSGSSGSPRTSRNSSPIK